MKTKELKERKQQAVKVTACLPPKDPYYPSGPRVGSDIPFIAIDRNVIDILSVEDQDRLYKMLDTMRTEHTTNAIQAYMDTLEDLAHDQAQQLTCLRKR